MAADKKFGDSNENRYLPYREKGINGTINRFGMKSHVRLGAYENSGPQRAAGR